MVGKGEAMNKGKGRGTILADFFEALVGAIYLDGGIDAARNFFFNQYFERYKLFFNHRNIRKKCRSKRKI